ncbi:DUF2807 domain-containing protein [Patescibacteria group bacterium]|nr:DUF2807 domain-containing protein [Patescibacteria group bacterium]
MSKLVAEINKRKVYSDKEVRAIVDTKVYFVDGSWCDVATGETVNNGPGSISFDNPGATAEKITVGPTPFMASSLEVRGVIADVEINVKSSPTIEVEITGPKKEVEAIKVAKVGDTVVVESEDRDTGFSRSQGTTVIAGSGNVVTRIGRARGMVISGDLVMGRRRTVISTGDMYVSGDNVILSGGGEASTKVIIGVPQKTGVTVTKVTGNTVIGDTQGRVSVSGNNGEMRIGRVGPAKLGVSGSSDISVKEVTGSMLDIRIMGSGDIRIEAGQVDQLSVEVMGSGDARFHGRATDSNLSIMGSGDIWVAHSVNKPVEDVMGSGDIHVSRVGN